MSNKSVLKKLLLDIDEYEQSRKDRDVFAQRIADSIESLEGIPYSVITEARDWRYRIETEGFFDDQDFESEIEEVIPKLKEWVNELIATHS